MAINFELIDDYCIIIIDIFLRFLYNYSILIFQYKVCISLILQVSTMQQPRLKDIDNSMVIAGKNLESAAPEDIHLKILESIAVNSDILKWIKGTAKGMIIKPLTGTHMTESCLLLGMMHVYT